MTPELAFNAFVVALWGFGLAALIVGVVRGALRGVDPAPSRHRLLMATAALLDLVTLSTRRVTA